jgi:hypothetical protein
MSKKIKQVIPAVSGTKVIYYNHCHNKTFIEPVLFWGLSSEDGEEFVVPLTLNEYGGFCTELHIPLGAHPEGHEREGDSSAIIAYEIPNWGRIELFDGVFVKSVDGFHHDLSPANLIFKKPEAEKP